MTDENDNMKQMVRDIFVNYLRKKKLRKTPERFAVLDEIYDTSGHFDIESLYNQLRDKKYRVSKATIYNTIEHLLACDLIIKHKFDGGGAKYERSYMFRQHDHFVDLDTGEVSEFCDPRILEIQQSIEKEFGVKISHHSLTFYGRKSKETI